MLLGKRRKPMAIQRDLQKQADASSMFRPPKPFLRPPPKVTIRILPLDQRYVIEKYDRKNDRNPCPRDRLAVLVPLLPLSRLLINPFEGTLKYASQQ